MVTNPSPHRVVDPEHLPAILASTQTHRVHLLLACVDACVQVLAQMRKWWPLLPNPTARLVTRWWNDPWTYGSYSYATTNCTGKYRGTPAERDAFQTPQSAIVGGPGRVWFAGEHTSINYPATMQGAFLSGKDAATNLAKVITKG